MDIQKARINTAGAYVCLDGFYPFAIGTRLHNGCIPVVRVGGHREKNETGWQCAARKTYEETSLRIKPLLPKATYLSDGDHIEAELQTIQWQHPTGESDPLLVVAYHREGGTVLSLMQMAFPCHPPRSKDYCCSKKRKFMVCAGNHKPWNNIWMEAAGRY